MRAYGRKFGCSAAALLLLALAAAPAAQAQSGGMFPAGFPRLPTREELNGMVYGYPEHVRVLNAEREYRGTYNHTTCEADVVVRPSSTAELAEAVRSLAAQAASQGRPLKIRATRDQFATMQSFPCSRMPTLPEAARGSGDNPFVAGVLLNKMNKVLAVDRANLQMRVEGQITLADFYKAATTAGLSIPRESLPWWQGLTLAGVMSTTSHGSGFNRTSMICDWTVSITWVDAAGNVHVSPRGSEEARGICGGVGLVGIIAELTLQMTETTNTRISTWYVRNDQDLASDIDKMLSITPHLVVMWRPDIGKYTGHMQRPAPADAPVEAAAQCNVIPQFAPITARTLGPGLRMWQADPFNHDASYAMGGDMVACTTAMTNAVGAAWVTKPSPLSESLGMPIPILEGVAPTNQVTSTECGDRCAWISKDMQATAMDVEFAFERARLPEVIADVRRLIAQDLKGIPGMWAAQRCLTPGYYVLRFGKTADSHIGMAANIKEPVYIQQQMLVSRNTPGIPSRYEWVQEAYEQMMLCKYNGHPHFGKNWDRTFTHPKCPIRARYADGFDRMAALQDAHDPNRVFEPELYARAAAGEGYVLKPKCVLDHSCFCEADEHCADGFACRPSRALPEYLTCQPRAIN